MRLGIDDPLAWWDRLPEPAIAFWKAFDQVEPIEYDGVPLAAIRSDLSLLRQAMLAPHVKHSSGLPKYIEPWKFLTKWFRPKQQPATQTQIAQQMKAVSRRGNNHQ